MGRLVLGVKWHQRVQIGDDIVVFVKKDPSSSDPNHGPRLVIEAPDHINIKRDGAGEKKATAGD